MLAEAFLSRSMLSWSVSEQGILRGQTSPGPIMLFSAPGPAKVHLQTISLFPVFSLLPFSNFCFPLHLWPFSRCLPSSCRLSVWPCRHHLLHFPSPKRTRYLNLLSSLLVHILSTHVWPGPFLTLVPFLSFLSRSLLFLALLSRLLPALDQGHEVSPSPSEETLRPLFEIRKRRTRRRRQLSGLVKNRGTKSSDGSQGRTSPQLTTSRTGERGPAFFELRVRRARTADPSAWVADLVSCPWSGRFSL